jgi:hypothetical protein
MRLKEESPGALTLPLLPTETFILLDLLIQPRLPAGRIDLYAVASGHRLIVGCSHNTMIDGGRPRPLPGPAP